MASGGGGASSHKRRLDNFLQGLGSSRTSSPSRPGSRMSALSDDRPTTPTPPTATPSSAAAANMLESISAKRQRLGIESSSSTLSPSSAYVGRSATSAGASANSTVANVLRKWGSRSNMAAGGSGSTSTGDAHANTPLPAFSSNRNSILLVNPSSAPTAVTRRLVPPAPVLYNPGDRDALIARLATFQDLTDWTPKPERASEVEWAKKGWVCRGRERVACSLCKRELIVGLNRKEVDGKEVSVLVASEIEDALVDKYVGMMVTEHLEDCPWRRLGCDDSLLRIPLSHSKDALVDLRARYDELVERKDFLPYEFNLRLPADTDLDTILAQLPPNFFTPAFLTPDDPTVVVTTTAATLEETPNRVALALALFGWQRLSNPRMGAVRDTVSCHTCLRRLGLWMFKSKQVGPDGTTILSPAPMDHLDPASEHRFFCPWKNAAAQRLDYNVPNPESDAAAWTRLVRIIDTEAKIRDASQPRKRGQSFIRLGRGHAHSHSTPVTPAKGSAIAAATSPSTPGTELVLSDDGGEFDERARDAKEKAMYSRLRRIKSLFIPKDKNKLSASASTTTRPSSRASVSRISPPRTADDAAQAGQGGNT